MMSKSDSSSSARDEAEAREELLAATVYSFGEDSGDEEEEEEDRDETAAKPEITGPSRQTSSPQPNDENDEFDAAAVEAAAGAVEAALASSTKQDAEEAERPPAPDGSPASSSISSSSSSSSASSSFAAEVHPAVAAVKAQLLDSFFGTNRGLSASAETRTEVNELIARLESFNPTPSPTAAMEALAGTWRLQYTTNSELLVVLAADNLPLVSVGEMTQTIDATTASVENRVALSAPLVQTSVGRSSGCPSRPSSPEPPSHSLALFPFFSVWFLVFGFFFGFL